MGGQPTVDVVDKFLFGSSATATDVGNLTVGRGYNAGQQSGSYCYSSGGNNGSYVNTIDRFATASDGNASDVGDLTQSRGSLAGVFISSLWICLWWCAWRISNYN